MTSPRILIVEDDREIAELVEENLVTLGFQVNVAHDGFGMFRSLADDTPDLILLDIMLPGEDGLALCRELRKTGSKTQATPLIFVTALGELADRAVGLEIGADDYITKPFEMRELVARVRALLRRSQQLNAQAAQVPPTGIQPGLSPAHILRFGFWRINMASHTLIDEGDVSVPLSALEFRLLSLFLRNPQRVLTRDYILDCMGNRSDNSDRVIDVQVSRLRSKLRDGGRSAGLIRTMRGDGYMLAVPVEKIP